MDRGWNVTTTTSDGKDLPALRRALLHWWEHHNRSYPWRATRDPYHVLAAELLLHRTRADQVVPFYQEFLNRYPTITSLAAADPHELQTMLHSVGLRWRVGLFVCMAQTVVVKHAGRIPRERNMLEELPGVGPYIAGAVRCFAYGEPDVLLDTNTVRIAGRVFDLHVTDASRRSRQFQRVLGAMLDVDHPREFNLALLDLGALVCKAGVPLCDLCPVRQHCSYGRTATQENVRK